MIQLVSWDFAWSTMAEVSHDSFLDERWGDRARVMKESRNRGLSERRGASHDSVCSIEASGRCMRSSLSGARQVGMAKRMIDQQKSKSATSKEWTTESVEGQAGVVAFTERTWAVVSSTHSGRSFEPSKQRWSVGVFDAEPQQQGVGESRVFAKCL